MKLSKILINLLTLLGLAIGINGLALLFKTNFNLGSLLTALLGVALTLLGIFFRKVSEFIPKWIRIAAVVLLSSVVFFSTFLLSYGCRDNVSYKEDAVIVLGAGVNGSRVSRVLADRLKAAIDYHNENPEALIVVSGGQGPQENISEALAMEQYLTAKGVPEELIIKEDKSTSTYENFKNSKAILDEKLGTEYTVSYVTNDFHIYRAGGIARNAGITNATHFHSSTRWYLITPSTLRECLAVAKFCIFGN